MAWIARLVALALVGVLADAAAASLHGAPLALFSVALGALAALVTLIVFWSRPWIACSFATALIACAFAVGTLGGVAGGPALTGFAPADAAAVVLALALCVAAAATCAALPNPWLRLIVLALAAYGVVTTLASVQNGGLPAAFAAAPLAWTRGPYVAAEVVLPLAVLVTLVDALRAFAAKRGARGVASLTVAGGLLAATQLGAFAAGAAGLPTLVAFEAPLDAARIAVPPAAPAPIAAAPAPASVSDIAAPPAIVTGAPFVPKGSGDVAPEVAAAVAGLAKDPQQALATVAGFADDLYPGALAGAVGTLRSGSGNSVDKALLLRDLLRAATPNAEVAFARCRLPADQADALIAQARAAKSHPKIILQAAGAAIGGAKTPAARATLQHWAQSWTDLVGQTKSESRGLAGSLQTAGLTLPAGDAAPERLRALAADHVWIRTRTNGSWTDFDPTIQPSAPGKTRCAAQSQSTALPDDLYDVFGARVVVETASSGARETRVIFDRTLRTADLGDRDVSFMFAEPTALEAAADASPSPAPGALTFTPLLRIGDESLTGTPIALPVPVDQSIAKAVGGAAGAAVDAFGAAGPSPSAAPPSGSPLPTTSGVWLELSVAAPGAKASVVRSPIFDRVGYAARANHATPPALAMQPDPEDYQAMQTVWNIVISAGHVTSAGGPANVPRSAKVPPLSAALARYNSAYFGVRRALIDDAHGGSVGVVASQPGISLLSMSNDGSLAIDIASDGAIPLTTDEARPLWASAAVLAERRMMTAGARDRNSNTTPVLPDVLFAFDGARASGARIVALHPGDAYPPAAVVSDEARARVAASLARGAAVLAPAPSAAQTGAPAYGYWIVDGTTGALRDENEFGRHPEMAERGVTTRISLQSRNAFVRVACRVVFVAMVWGTQDSSWAEGKSFEDAQAAEQAAEEAAEADAEAVEGEC